jgi:hypothetical protein
MEKISDFVYKKITSFGEKCFDLIKGNDMDKTLRWFRLCLLYDENTFDDELFMKWLNSPNTTHHYFHSSGVFSYSEWNNTISILYPKLCDNSHITNVIEAYLEHFYEKGDNLLRKFKKIIGEGYLK